MFNVYLIFEQHWTENIEKFHLMNVLRASPSRNFLLSPSSTSYAIIEVISIKLSAAKLLLMDIFYWRLFLGLDRPYAGAYPLHTRSSCENIIKGH